MITPGEWVAPSITSENNAVMARFVPDHQEVDVRDRKDSSEYFTFSRWEWEAFTTAVKAGEFDLPPVPDMMYRRTGMEE